MPKVVSDTTPIISLLKIAKLELLKHIYSEIFIPVSVFEEIEAGRNRKHYRDISQLNWIRIEEIKDKRAGKYFLDLHTGEAEAIILASEISADLIIMDEKLGRYYAKHADLKVTGTLGVLAKAKELGFIKEIKPLVKELIEKDFWISEKTLEAFLILVGE